MFYLKLAGQNIRKSMGVFAPFVLASLVLFTLICSMFLIMLSPVMKTMGSGAISIGLGVIILTIFSVIMEIYSFNFLMKQRAREFGLYNMLGMNKKKVALIASLELMMIFLLVVVLGSVLAGVFANVLYLIFVNITHYSDLHFGIEPLAFVMTAFLFAGFFFLLELLAIRTIGKTSPLILFRASEKGEREPKGNVLLAALGVFSLGMGYYLSLSSKAEGLAVIYRFFIAVLFVIAGTYLFYISFMTWYLKARRKNKRYFYTPEHFITTSQMIFRMKQHATGLANITLLAVMAFVTIATTTSLYTGMSSMTGALYPKETSITYKVSDRSQGEMAFQQSVLSHFPEKADDSLSYLTYQAGLVYDGGEEIVISPKNISNPDFSKMAFTYFITQDDFRKLGNDLPELAANQVVFMRPSEKTSLKKLVLGDQSFENVANLDKAIFPDITNTLNAAVMVVSDDTVLNAVREYYESNNPQGYLVSLDYRVFTDLTDEEVLSLGEQSGEIYEILDENGEYLGNVMQRTDFNNLLMGFTGGFLFTGFLLGISFLLGAALIIYYKQYSEGHEDKKSYKILQEVGMSQKAVKKTINSQTLTVFFMPLVMATLHFVIALIMLKQMLLSFGVTSSLMIYTVSGITLLAVTLIYFVIYKWTSRTYYRIIER
ncbi:FtsX-like permease family protein [Streptococcus suis]|uniref:Putative transporter permease protein n=1 Tax=Streptococcus suis TaxID=1307 RepID=A0A0Z8ARV4_STRSU|nr:FtsX-like permease family protein [Streptococcus suis]NQH91739.1 FtsX-like permease family protein [Streptococcus suis]NQI11556.1 FtsX-like permease family protein [Streptococcus suis]NQN89478.1 FtsX-like permease family protein [Streptococcus suis]NQO11695.1 FtsX-like permease family protein [Streptococcus suis]NQO17510.1 FtsX-like permease family protein [Streptococcus suis]